MISNIKTHEAWFAYQRIVLQLLPCDIRIVQVGHCFSVIACGTTTDAEGAATAATKCTKPSKASRLSRQFTKAKSHAIRIHQNPSDHRTLFPPAENSSGAVHATGRNGSSIHLAPCVARWYLGEYRVQMSPESRLRLKQYQCHVTTKLQALAKDRTVPGKTHVNRKNTHPRAIKAGNMI